VREALRWSRRPSEVRRHLGDLLTTLGKYEDAIEEYRTRSWAIPSFAQSGRNWHC
jgi:hypothetical protein